MGLFIFSKTDHLPICTYTYVYMYYIHIYLAASSSQQVLLNWFEHLFTSLCYPSMNKIEQEQKACKNVRLMFGNRRMSIFGNEFSASIFQHRNCFPVLLRKPYLFSQSSCCMETYIFCSSNCYDFFRRIWMNIAHLTQLFLILEKKKIRIDLRLIFCTNEFFLCEF